MRKSALSVLSVGLILSTASTAAAQAEESARAAETQQNKRDYIVVFKPGVVAEQDVDGVVDAIKMQHGAAIVRSYKHAIQGAALTLTPGAAAALAKDDRVAYVEEDRAINESNSETPASSAKSATLEAAPMSLTSGAVTLAAASVSNVSESTESWGLDRLDQRNMPIDGVFNYPDQAGQGVHIYHVSYGANLTHNEFLNADGTRHIVTGWNFVNNNNITTDNVGWGAMQAGIMAGNVYGVAKKSTVHVVKVINDNSEGFPSIIVAGIDWVTQNHIHPAVMYVHNQNSYESQAINDAVTAAINHGVTVVAMAGNNNIDASIITPANLPAVIAVGGTRYNDPVTQQPMDYKLECSNYGSTVDIFAPGFGIGGSSRYGDAGIDWASGTDLAASLVVGVAALYLGQNPSALPAEVANALISQATTDVIVGLPAGTPNRLLYEGFLTTLPSPDSPCSGLCSNPVNISWSGSYQGNNVGTGALCYQTTQTINGGNCGNFASTRTLKVNGVTERCDYSNWTSVPAKRNGGYCIQVTAGDYPWAYMTLW